MPDHHNLGKLVRFCVFEGQPEFLIRDGGVRR